MTSGTLLYNCEELHEVYVRMAVIQFMLLNLAVMKLHSAILGDF